MLAPKLSQKDRLALEEEARLEEELNRRLCTRSLYHFTKQFWHLIEPGTKFVDGWHIRAICDFLERATEFEIQRGIVNMPPRHMKSILVSVMWPAWVWIRYPERRFIFASYSQPLALRDAVKMRLIIESDQYRNMFKIKWSLRQDQNIKSKFENTQSGYRYSVGVGGTVTGEGGDYLVQDDPLNALDANSPTVRDATNVWNSTVWSSRANDPLRHVRIIVMQRLHEEDPTGFALKAEEKQDPDLPKYVRLILQARYEPKTKIVSTPGLFSDPRTEKGQPLWPERFNDLSLRTLGSELDSTGLGQSHAQLQQDPKPASGGLFKREWWQPYSAAPSPILEIVQFIDAAQKPGITNDNSCIATVARTDSGYYWLDLWCEKVDMPTLEAITKQKYAQWKPDAVVIEDKAGGSSLIQYLLRATDIIIPVLPFDPGQRDKEVRASAAAPTVKGKRCHLPSGAEWVEDFVSEHERFPKASNDDRVDTTSMAIEYFARKQAGEPRVRTL